MLSALDFLIRRPEGRRGLLISPRWPRYFSRMSKLVGLPDAMSDVLDLVRMRAELVCAAAFSAPWSFSFGKEVAHFHIVEQGSAWLEVTGAAPVRVETGDLLILPLATPQAKDAFVRSIEWAARGPVAEADYDATLLAAGGRLAAEVRQRRLAETLAAAPAMRLTLSGGAGGGKPLGFDLRPGEPGLWKLEPTTIPAGAHGGPRENIPGRAGPGRAGPGRAGRCGGTRTGWCAWRGRTTWRTTSPSTRRAGRLAVCVCVCVCVWACARACVRVRVRVRAYG